MHEPLSRVDNLVSVWVWLCKLRYIKSIYRYLTIIGPRRSYYCWIIPEMKSRALFNNFIEPEVNNCFSIFTRSDLNRIRKETIKKLLVWLTGEFIREHEPVNSGCAIVRSLQYLQTWQMMVLIFLFQFL